MTDLANKPQAQQATAVDADGQKLLEWTGPVPFPEPGPEQLKQAFKILNAWARRLKEWEDNVRALGLILQTRYEFTEKDVEDVITLFKDKNGKDTKEGAPDERHKPRFVRELFRQQGKGSDAMKIFIGATDVVGHPPENPFQEPM